jgi:hypothetical protein
MSGFKSKAGEFYGQFEDFKSKPAPLKEISVKEYNEFFNREGGPHQLEGMMHIGGEILEYINIRRSKLLGGEIIIEPVTKQNETWVVAVQPQDINGYRVKLSGGRFDITENKWEFELANVLEIPPGAAIGNFHKDLDAALRVKFSLAERLLFGENVQSEVQIYREEQPFYRGEFGKIIAADPIKEAYLRDAFLAEIERVITTKDHSGVKTSHPEAMSKAKLELEIYPKTFMGAKCLTAKISFQKVGGHPVVIFSDSKPGSGIVNQFELHGGRASNLIELVIKTR